jgi:hypothetical protein
MSLKELQKLCAARALKTHGSKADLVKRLSV